MGTEVPAIEEDEPVEETDTYAAQKALRDRYIRGKDGTNREYVVGTVIHRLPEVEHD